ncbi:unnamed protein product [Spirodela intermedia]|uniref:Uncharacterized protein n=1 Tax=Spirodela intermedia TaxID=51605 RepID=A0A7I8ITK1_SPIIN|nr:unnamed protein product [Spirodela intermedia]CAA6660937.1 unnamed protein product [Spirodela intermedia]
MGLSFSSLSSPWIRSLRRKAFGLAENVEVVLLKSLSFNEKDVNRALRALSFKDSNGEQISAPDEPSKNAVDRSLSFRNWGSGKPNLQVAISFRALVSENEDTESISLWSAGHEAVDGTKPEMPPLPESSSSPRSMDEKDAAATKLQKFYKGYRIRRNLADCAVVVEELWWKALDFASLSKSSISFFNDEKPETAVSRWARARTRAAKLGKGLSKNEKAQKLALRHWLEAIDPRHRYGHNLHLYYEIWFNSESSEPFFYWLDIGSGKEVSHEKCSRSKLQRQCIQYLGPWEAHLQAKSNPVSSVEGSKWIFVLSTSRKLYIGQLPCRGATTSAGRLVAINGVLKAIWPYSGHYLPTEENFKEFISFLTENNVDLTDVKETASSDDSLHGDGGSNSGGPTFALGGGGGAPTTTMSSQWTTGAGPRIGCVRDYPVDLQFMALEQVNLSPRVGPPPAGSKGPIPSPRPSPQMRLSPRLAQMASPALGSLSLSQVKGEILMAGA